MRSPTQTYPFGRRFQKIDKQVVLAEEVNAICLEKVSLLRTNQGWFAQLERRALYRGVFTSVAELQDALYEFIRVHNRNSAKPFTWKKDAKTILAAVERAKDALPY